MSHADLILFCLYVLIGPLAWGFLGFMAMMGRRRMRRLARPALALPNDPPRVTVLVPAKDEGERVRVCLESVLAQDYPNFSVVTIDDRSTDETGRILDEIAAASGGKVRSLHIAHGALPDGWLGKCHALHVGAKEAAGEWLLFVDSDVRLEPDALSATLALSVAREYDAMSLMTALECHTFLERLVLPLTAGAWSIMHLVSFTNTDNRPNIAYANGQFFLIRRTTYEAAGGHEAVRDQITEDVELARRMKQRGAQVRLMFGAPFASTRMHATLPQMLRGWGRIYSGTSRRRPWRILASAAFILVCGFSAYAALAWTATLWTTRGLGVAWPWLGAVVAHLVLMTATLAGIYTDSRNPRRYALLFPLSGTLMLAIFAFAIRWCITGRIEWRGTVFQQQDRPSSSAA
ncbi:MAG: glycosyltransferase family A protein [Tepidisphaeraceae bacterium]